MQLWFSTPLASADLPELQALLILFVKIWKINKISFLIIIRYYKDNYKVGLNIDVIPYSLLLSH